MNLKVLILFQFVAVFMYLEKAEAEEHKFGISWLHDEVYINVDNGKVEPVSAESFRRTFFECSGGNLNEQIFDHSIDESYKNYEFMICAEDTNTKLYVHPHSE